MKIKGPKKNQKIFKNQNFSKFPKNLARKTSGNNSQHLETTFPTIRTKINKYSKSSKKVIFKKKCVFWAPIEVQFEDPAHM